MTIGITKIDLYIPTSFLVEFDRFVEELQTKNLIVRISNIDDIRSDVILAAIQHFMDEWKGEKEEIEEKKKGESELNIYLSKAHSSLPRMMGK